jgi:Glyoxalase-like domain
VRGDAAFIAGQVASEPHRRRVTAEHAQLAASSPRLWSTSEIFGHGSIPASGRRVRVAGHTVQRAADTAGMTVRLHHIVVDAHDLPALARFWTQALGWKVLSEREREIVIGPDENAPVGMYFMPVTDPKTVKTASIVTSLPALRTTIRRLTACLLPGRAGRHRADRR